MLADSSESMIPAGGEVGLVLVADDDSAIRGSIARILSEHFAFEVLAVSDGQEAQDAFEDARFELVVLDVSMPRLSGIEALRSIRALSPDVPVLVVSASTDQRDSALAAGADAFLPKPFTEKQLVGLVERVLSRSGEGSA